MMKNFYRDGVVYTLPKVVNHGLTLLLLPVYTRALSARDYGSLDLFLVFVGLVQIVITLEIQQGLARFYGTQSESSARKDYAISSIVFTVFIYSVFALFAFIFEKELANIIFQQEGRLVEYRLGIGFVWFNGVLQLLLALLRWDLRSREFSLTQLLNTFLNGLLGVILVVVFRMGLSGLLLSMLLSAITCSCLLCYRLKSLATGRFNRQQLVEMLSFSAPLVFSSLAVMSCFYIDRLMIQSILGLEFVGAYGVAYRIAAIAGLAVAGFQGALMPLIYKHHESPETPGKLAELFNNFVGGALALLLFAQIFAGDILYLLADPKFHTAKGCLILLFPVVVLSRLYVFAPGLSLKKKSMLITFINTGGAVSNIALNAILIPQYGLSGAASASLLSFAILFTIHMYVSQKHYPVPHSWARILSGCIMLPAVYGLSQIIDKEIGTLSHYMINFVLLGVGLVLLFQLGLIRFPSIKPVE